MYCTLLYCTVFIMISSRNGDRESEGDRKKVKECCMWVYNNLWSHCGWEHRNHFSCNRGYSILNAKQKIIFSTWHLFVCVCVCASVCKRIKNKFNIMTKPAYNLCYLKILAVFQRHVSTWLCECVYNYFNVRVDVCISV